MSHDFRAPWAQGITEEEWRGFLVHNHNDASRDAIYSFVEDWLEKNKEMFTTPISFAEVGFGQLLDFQRCFWRLHCLGKIVYTGYEITEQFVKYAIGTYPGNNFKVGGFKDLSPGSYGITYSRHVIEHQHPDEGYDAFIHQLQAANRLCIVCWFVPPGEERFQWVPSDGFGHSGAYVNRYSKTKIIDIILQNGFSLDVVEKRVGNTPHVNAIYIMRKSG